jgi:hypothetical protein
MGTHAHVPFSRRSARCQLASAARAMPAAVLAAHLAVLWPATPAHAQLMLPGALHAAPPAERDKPGPAPGGGGPAKPKPVVQKAPDESAIIGRELARDGAFGVLVFGAGPSKTLMITQLSFEGEQISRPHEACRVNVVAGEMLEAKFIGRSNGLARYAAEIEACPFAFEILDGAVLVASAPKVCEFLAADCRVDPAGLWGPKGERIEEAEIKNLERARAQAETNMRTNFRALLGTAGKDKEAIKSIAAEQAGFSSQRAMICADYAREEIHGICALRITQARVFALQAQYEARASEKPSTSAEKGPLRSFRSQATTGSQQSRPDDR